ncbi:MAG: anti-sigma F factor [Oscillospiraceae bacterium]|jgi:stage II sporulation protein AB (anti-sigma F factor)|nr:anti-sigma F factor [Oscillospiraceae bacterium]
MKPVNEIKMTFPSRSVNERYARVAVAAFAAQLDPTLDEINDIKTVISEAVTNSIVHAYPDSIGDILILARIYPNGIFEMTITDKGIGIEDIERARQPMFTTGGDDRSGMGFTIMESFTDKLTVHKRRGGGTIVKMKKQFSPRLSG